MAVINCFGAVRVINSQDALAYWVSGQFPLMNVSFHNTTLWSRCFEEEGNVRNPYRYIDNNFVNIAFS